MTTLMKMVAGSRLFGLDTPESDTGTYEIFFDPMGVFDDARRKTTHFGEGTSEEGVRIELSQFMNALRKKDLKALELLGSDTPLAYLMLEINESFRHEFMYTLRNYANELDLRDMFKREIERRYNKTWFKEINPKAKNYNQEQEYDTKFAAHLFRVLSQAVWYTETGTLLTRQVGLSLRTPYLSIKRGDTPKSVVLSITTTLKDYALERLDNMETAGDPEFPHQVYFDVYKNLEV